MSLLKNLVSDNSIAAERDSIGGSSILESGIYQATIKLAYVNVSAGGAMGLVLQAETATGEAIRETMWMSSGTAKGSKNYYERNGKKNYLPGYIAANSLAVLTTGKEISELETSEKVVKVYNKEAKAEMPTKVPMIMDLLGKEVIFGIIKENVDKTEKADDGSYVPTGETRFQNVIDKVFRASDGMTTTEASAGAEEANFINAWKNKWNGEVKDRVSKSSGTPGAPKNTSAPAKKTTSLFG